MKGNEKYTLKQLRGLRDMSQEELAVKSGVTSRSVAIYEKSPEAFKRASFETVAAIALALNVEIKQIFFGEDFGKTEKISQKRKEELEMRFKVQKFFRILFDL